MQVCNQRRKYAVLGGYGKTRRSALRTGANITETGVDIVISRGKLKSE